MASITSAVRALSCATVASGSSVRPGPETPRLRKPAEVQGCFPQCLAWDLGVSIDCPAWGRGPLHDCTRLPSRPPAQPPSHPRARNRSPPCRTNPPPAPGPPERGRNRQQYSSGCRFKGAEVASRRCVPASRFDEEHLDGGRHAPRGLSTINLWADDLPAATHRDGTVSVAWWLRDENGEWQPWMKNTSRRPVPHPRRRRASSWSHRHEAGRAWDWVNDGR